MAHKVSAVAVLSVLIVACDVPENATAPDSRLEAPALAADIVEMGPGVWRETLNSRGFANAVNGNGDVAGHNYGLAFYWTETGGYVGSPFPAYRSNAFGIRDDGVLVGNIRRYHSSGSASPMRWAPGDAEATPLSSYYGEAYAINTAGTIVGEVWMGNSWHAVTWDAAGTMTDLGASESFLGGASLNEIGDVVFTTDDYRIVVWWAGDDGPTDTGLNGLAMDINDAGQITGWRWYEDYTEEGFVLDPDGTYTVVPGFEPYPAHPEAINNQGHVVGTGLRRTSPYSASSSAFYWAPGCELIALDPTALSGAKDLNEIGHAAGFTHRYGFIPVRWTIDLDLACVPTATPAEQMAELADEVGALEDAGVLSRGVANALTAKLDAALNQLDRDNTTAAANQLGAFINAVEALIRSGRLHADTGAELIASARAIIDAIS